MSTNLRPDYNLMMEKSVAVNSKSPSVSIVYNNIAPETLQFIGIFIPPTNVSSFAVKKGDHKEHYFIKLSTFWYGFRYCNMLPFRLYSHCVVNSLFIYLLCNNSGNYHAL